MAVGQGRRSRSQAAGVDRELVHFLRDHLGQIHPKSFATSPSIAPRSATWATGSADLGAHVGEQTFSRLVEMSGIPVFMYGEDQRFKRAHAERAGELGLEPPT